MNNNFDRQFWKMLDRLIAESEMIVDRKKNTQHPKYPDFIYPLDYGYLKGTTSMDGGGIDVWLGTSRDRKLDAIICTVDITKKDSEIKLLIGCTSKEKETVYNFHNESSSMKGILIER